MPSPYSNDFRTKIVEAVEQGSSCRQVAKQFRVSPSCVIKLMQRFRATGDVAPAQFGGFKRSPLLEHEQAIRDWLEETPDLTIAELGARLAELGTKTSPAAICRYLQKLELTRKKKTMRASEQSRDDVAKARNDWRGKQSKMRPEQLIFIDETWTSTNMAPRYGRTAKGKRVEGVAPHGHWLTTTFLAALRHDRIDAPCVFNGPINGACFRAWTEQALAPTLKPGDLVIMDNLSSHKVAGVREAIESRGATVHYLPPYSPDMNPIEQVFAKLKHFLRKTGARTVETLHNAIGELIDQFSPQECYNYIRASGYGST